MCGIVGFSGQFAPELLARMSQSVAHRGPDGHGSYVDVRSGIGLAHRRLAIIDLSPTGQQPMADPEGRAVIVFNGEIYNFRGLRQELTREGRRFRGNSDTEVLLHLYLRDGPDMLARLNGIFSFAIWDIAKRELFLARDGLGVKPFYYSETPRGFIFASEIKALLREPSVSRAINPAAVARYLTFLWSPAPETILAGVSKLEPGMAMLVADGAVVRKWRHYDLPCGQGKLAISQTDATEALRTVLDRAVERQMVADVPVGAFLSGGLDSSAVVAFARRHTRERLQCFTIAFADAKAAAAEGMAADLPFAKRVAEHLDVDLHTITVGPEMTDHLQEMIYHLDEPQADPAALNTLFISRLARTHGIKVLLSGAGGDDILTGYRRHLALSRECYWTWLPKGVRRRTREIAAWLPVKNPFFRRLRKGLEYAELDADDRLASYFFWLSPDLASDLLIPEMRPKAHVAMQLVAQPMLSALRNLPQGATALDRMLYLEGKFFLADHNLAYTDKMSMAHGVEVRVPLLDPEFVNFAARLPDRMKQKGSTGKWIFKKAMEPLLPHDVIYRPKTGFGVPLRRWIRHELRPLIDDVLSADAIKKRGFLNASAIEQTIRSDREGRIDAAYTIFALLCIELWFRIFLDEQPAWSTKLPMVTTKARPSI